MRYVYGFTTALLLGGASLSLTTGKPAGAQVAQNDGTAMERIVPRQGAPLSFADLTEQLQPAVVNISTRQRIEVRQQANPFAGTPFADFLTVAVEEDNNNRSFEKANLLALVSSSRPMVMWLQITTLWPQITELH